MYFLAGDEFSVVSGFLQDIPFNSYFAKSVLDGKVAGIVVVDDRHNPQSLYIRHDYGMSLLCGNSNNAEFNQQLIDFLRNDIDFTRPEYLQVYPPDWNSVLQQILGYELVSCDDGEAALSLAAVIKHVRVNFKFDYQRYLSLLNAVDFTKYDLRRLNADQALAITGVVVPRYYWKTPELFEQYAVAYGLFVDGELAVIACSSCRDNSIIELGMEAQEKFRGRGLAQVVCLKLVAETLKLGLEPVWACRKGNIGSYKLAQKVGFVAESEWPYYQILRKNR